MYPKSSVEVRFHFRVRVQASFTLKMEEPQGTRPESIELHISGAQKEETGGVHSACGKAGGVQAPVEGPGEDQKGSRRTWRGMVPEQRSLEGTGA